MATTTTNYGFDIPQSTDLVKDGATAIATLGQDIDTAMNTALGTKKAGMVLLNTTSFSGVASQSVNDVFSATYDNYRFILDIISTTSDNIIYMKMRSSGTDNSTNYYSMMNGVRSDGSAFTQTENNVTTGFALTLCDSANSNQYGFNGDLCRPFLSATTMVRGINNSSTSTGIPASQSGGGLHAVVASYTSLNLIASAGNMTGSIKIYGYNN